MSPSTPAIDEYRHHKNGRKCREDQEPCIMQDNRERCRCGKEAGDDPDRDGG